MAGIPFLAASALTSGVPPCFLHANSWNLFGQAHICIIVCEFVGCHSRQNEGAGII